MSWLTAEGIAVEYCAAAEIVVCVNKFIHYHSCIYNKEIN